MAQNELTHYGVLGMKWGVRRTEAQLARARAKRAVEEPHEDYTRAHTKKSVKSMSDKELKDVNKRLQAEDQYNQLTKKKVSAGQKFVTGVLITVGTQIATKYVSRYANKGIDVVSRKVTNFGLGFHETKIKV